MPHAAFTGSWGQSTWPRAALCGPPHSLRSGMVYGFSPILLLWEAQGSKSLSIPSSSPWRSVRFQGDSFSERKMLGTDHFVRELNRRPEAEDLEVLGTRGLGTDISGVTGVGDRQEQRRYWGQTFIAGKFLTGVLLIR